MGIEYKPYDPEDGENNGRLDAEPTGGYLQRGAIPRPPLIK